MKGFTPRRARPPTPSPSSINAAGSQIALETPRPPNVSNEGDLGFLGSTAFNAVFSDNQEHIPSFNATDVDPSNGSIRLHEEITASWRSSLRRGNRDATFVLELLKDTPHLSKIVGRWSSVERSYCILGAWVQECQESVRQDLYEKYDLTRNNVLGTVIALLNANTEATLRLPNNVRFRGFASYYTGRNLRWEAIGVFLTVCGLVLFGMPCDAMELDFVGNQEQDKQRLMFRVLQASEICVSVCNDAVQGTDLGFWLMLENCIYATQVLGDAHYSIWRKLGDLSTAVFARGLHASREAADEPFWLKEIRRRGLGYAYAMDKMLSTFVGRPPRVSKRYCNIEIPLDLEYDELALEGDELASVCSKLDAGGWYPRDDSARERASAFIRPYVLGASIREDTLELCLGPPQDNLREKAQSIICRSKELYASLPQWLQHSPKMWMSHNSKPQWQTVSQYLDNVYNEFMLRRMLVRRLHDDPTELVLLAHEILEAVIEARNIRSVLQNGGGMPWIIVLYGLPAAGVLALELLQLNVKAISHAKIKQNLSVFISYLKWAHVPGDGNYILADRGRKTLQHILDKVLDTDPARLEQPVQPATDAPTKPSGLDSVGLIDDLGVYDFSWLDADHFDQDFWDSLNSIDSGLAA